MSVEVWEGEGECPKCEWTAQIEEILVTNGLRAHIYAAVGAAAYHIETGKGPAKRKAKERLHRMTAIKEGLHRHYCTISRDDCDLTAAEIVLLSQSLEWWGQHNVDLLIDSDNEDDCAFRQKLCDNISIILQHYQNWMVTVGACAVKPADRIKTVKEINEEAGAA